MRAHLLIHNYARTFANSNPQTLKHSNPQTLKPSNLQTLKPSIMGPCPSGTEKCIFHINLYLKLIDFGTRCSQTLKPSNPQTLKPSNPQTLKLSNPQTLKPSNLQTFKPSNPQTAVYSQLCAHAQDSGIPFHCFWICCMFWDSWAGGYYTMFHRYGMGLRR